MYETLDSKILPMAAVINDKKEGYIGAADSKGKLNDYSRYAQEFNETTIRYFKSDECQEYLRKNDISLDDLTGLGSVEMPDGIIAALIHYDNGDKYMVSNGRFVEQVSSLVSRYHIPFEIAERYVLDHELTHINCNSEVGTAQKQKEFYQEKAAQAREEGNEVMEHQYETLAEMASDYIEAQESREEAA